MIGRGGGFGGKVRGRARGRGSGRRRRRGKGTAAVESHSACAGKVVLVGADFLNGLLGHDIAGCEEYLLPCVEHGRSVPEEGCSEADLDCIISLIYAPRW